MKKLIACLFGLMVSISSAFADLDPCRNLFNAATITDGYNLGDTGNIGEKADAEISGFIAVQPNTKYTLSFDKVDSGVYTRIVAYNSSQEFSSLLSKSADTTSGTKVYTVTTTADTAYIRFALKNTSTNIQFELGATKTEYTPHLEICDTCSGTITTQANLLDTAIEKLNGSTKQGQYPYSYASTAFYNVFFEVEANTSYTYTATTAGSRHGIYEYYSVINPDDYITDKSLDPDNVIKEGGASGLLTDTFTTGPNTKMIMLYLCNTNNPHPENLQIYPTNRPVGTVYCRSTPSANPIKIATTAYNSARFSPVVTELNDTIATIRSVVTNTINQTKAIADLQATKQTRPDETCPAGKKCLLVEDNDGQPHWYEIIESASRLPDGFTELEYIKKNSLAYIDSGISQTDSVGVSIDIKFDSYNTGTYYQYALGAYNAGDYIGIWKANNSTVSLCFVSSIATVSSSDNTNFHNFKINYLNSRKFSYDDSNVRDIDQTKSATSPSIYIGDTNYSQHFGNSSFSIKRVRISNETDIVFDGIPAKTTINGTEVVGLYDTVSETFKTATSGTFIAGPEVQ